jgi:prolyl oligopeptidase
LHVLDEGVSTLESLSASDGPGPWTQQAIDLGDAGALAFLGTDRSLNALWVTHEGFLSPPTLALVSGSTFSPALQAPALFDAKAFTVERRQARSADGTAVPYWLVGPKDDLPRPTHLFAYGGFANTLMPSYAGTYEATPGVYGRLWLEEGGRFVVPNLRGGGLFGPAWHQAALGPNRIKSFEDLEAVVDDLTAAGLTTPAQMSIEGRSNGGLLVFAALTRRPQGYGAIISGVPLADMLRYHTLLAGASWIGEYGDPRKPEERAWLETYSPYQKLRAGQAYAPTFIYGSAGDDRVHPAHGRWMAAKLKALGAPVWYWETEDGGHGNPVRREDLAQRLALTYTHLWKHLGAAPPLPKGAP